MYILGISGIGLNETAVSMAVGHDPAAALIKDGKIIAAAEEERFIRVKHAPGYFPFNAIKFCLNYAGIDISDVDHITGSYNPDLVFRNAFFPEKYYINPRDGIKSYILWKIYKIKYLNNIKYLSKYFNKSKDESELLTKKFKIIEHHMCHAASAFYCSGFDSSSVLTLDGAGEHISTLIGDARDNKIRKIKETHVPNSWGKFYSMFTEYLGFEPNDAEYKVMGLAPYGKPGVDMKNLVTTKNGTYKMDSRIWGEYRRYSDYIIKRFGRPRYKNETLEQHHKDIAYALQEKLQDEVLKLVEWTVDYTGNKKLSFAGGVAMNSKLNGFLLRNKVISDIFIQPGAGDNGTAIGSALQLYAQLGYNANNRLENVYFGPEFSNEEIKAALDRYQISYNNSGDIAGEVASLIADGNIIGWFQGRMEFGARALGCRSILADSTDPEMRDKVNAAIKFREGFRPFCPSMLAEVSKEYLKDLQISPFMILTSEVFEKKIKEIPSVVHIDGTVRPQTVEKKVNPKFYRLIKEFEKKSGVPVILNTSFNIADEPIVCSPKDAIRTFFSSGLDYLAIGDYLVKK